MSFQQGEHHCLQDQPQSKKPRKLKEEPKKRLRSACSNCRSKRKACDRKRPCGRCLASGQARTCVDPWESPPPDDGEACEHDPMPPPPFVVYTRPDVMCSPGSAPPFHPLPLSAFHFPPMCPPPHMPMPALQPSPTDSGSPVDNSATDSTEDLQTELATTRLELSAAQSQVVEKQKEVDTLREEIKRLQAATATTLTTTVHIDLVWKTLGLRSCPNASTSCAEPPSLVVRNADTEQVLFVSPPFLSLFGYSEQEFLRKQVPWTALVHPSCWEWTGRIIKKINESTTDCTSEFSRLYCVHKNGATFETSISICLIIDPLHGTRFRVEILSLPLAATSAPSSADSSPKIQEAKASKRESFSVIELGASTR